MKKEKRGKERRKRNKRERKRVVRERREERREKREKMSLWLYCHQGDDHPASPNKVIMYPKMWG